MEYDTIVVGLGAAGVTAASELARAGLKVLGLEAQDRIGGRVFTHAFGNGVVELGAEWIHGTENSRVYETGIKNNIDIIPHDLTLVPFRSDGSVADSNITNDLIDYSFAITSEPEKPEPLGEYITRKLMIYIEEKYPHLLKDKDYIDEFLLLINLFMNNHESSNDWNDVNVFSRYEELEGHQHMSWHKHGYKTFFELLLNTYKNGKGYPNLEIKLNTEVTNIKWPLTKDGKVVVTTKHGDCYRAKNVIITVSVGVLKATHATLFTPGLPKDKITAINTIPIGVMDKVDLSFEKPWWGTDGAIFGFIWRGEDRRAVSSEDYWTTRIFGASNPKGSDNVLTLWTSGDVAILVETLPEDVVKKKCIELLKKFLGKKYTITEPTGFIRSTWFNNPFTRGSYSFDNHAVVANPIVREHLLEPLKDAAGQPRVLFAGEATEDVHFSTVHGASDSGLREAMRLLPCSKL